jgi:hypothetical protein
MLFVTTSVYSLLLAASGRVGLAAPPSLAIHRRISVPVKATTTRDAAASVCTNGVPASKQHPAGYPINDYTVVTPDANNWTSYSVAKDWYREHFVSGPHVSSVFGQQMLPGESLGAEVERQTISASHLSDPYGPFKCQYTCNAARSCNAYLAWYGE